MLIKSKFVIRYCQQREAIQCCAWIATACGPRNDGVDTSWSPRPPPQGVQTTTGSGGKESIGKPVIARTARRGNPCGGSAFWNAAASRRLYGLPRRYAPRNDGMGRHCEGRRPAAIHTAWRMAPALRVAEPLHGLSRRCAPRNDGVGRHCEGRRPAAIHTALRMAQRCGSRNTTAWIAASLRSSQ
jgi:hypothetical protein